MGVRMRVVNSSSPMNKTPPLDIPIEFSIMNIGYYCISHMLGRNPSLLNLLGSQLSQIQDHSTDPQIILKRKA